MSQLAHKRRHLPPLLLRKLVHPGRHRRPPDPVSHDPVVLPIGTRRRSFGELFRTWIERKAEAARMIGESMASAAIAGIDPESDAQLVFAGMDRIWNRIGVPRNRPGERESGEFGFPERRIGRRVCPHEAEGSRSESSQREQERTKDQAEPETSHMEL